MATEAASAKAAELGLPKLNFYPNSRGGKGGSRGGNGARGGHGANGAPPGKPQRRRTLERKLARAKGTNRMVDTTTGTMMGRAAALTNAKTKLQRRLAAEGGAAVGEVDPNAPLLPVKKKQKMAANPVKKAQLLPSTGADAATSTLPSFLRALGVSAGDRDENGERPWDIDEEMRYYEQQLGVRKLKKKKQAAAAAAAAKKAADANDSRLSALGTDGSESDDAELDKGAMSKLRQELDEDGLGDLFDFCELLEEGGGEGGDYEEGAGNSDDDAAEEIGNDEPFDREESSSSSKKTKKSKVKSKGDDGDDGADSGYSLERQQRILAKEAAINAREDEMAAAIKKAMEAQARKVAKANKKNAQAEEEEAEEEDEDADADDDMKAASRKRRRGDDDEEDEQDDDEGEDDEAEDDEDGEEGEDDEEDDGEDEEEEEGEDGEEAEAGEGSEDEENGDEEDGDAEMAAAAEPVVEKRKGLSVADMYGFNAPVPESLLAFRRGDKNILTGSAGAAAASAGATNGTAAAAAAPAAPAKYVPPHLRAQMAAAAAAVGAPATSAVAAAAANVGVASASTAAGQAALRRQLKGLLNRLTSANLEHIALQMTSTLYAQHSKREVTAMLCDELLALCTLESDSTTGGYTLGSNSETLLAASALVVFLHATGVGQDIGAHFLEKFVLAFREHAARAKELAARAASTTGGGANAAAAAGALRSCTTLVTFLTYLYQLDLVGSKFIYELVRYFIDDFTTNPTAIELLLVVLANGGGQMRRDDPTALKEIILLVQVKAKEMQAAAKAAATATSPSTTAAIVPEGRINFMLETIYDLKNNKKRAVAGGVSDPAAAVAPLATWLNAKLKRRKDVTVSDWQLRIGFEDICNIESKGRWWLVGSAWKGTRQGGAAAEEEERRKAEAEASSKSANGQAAKVSLPAEDATEKVDLLSLARSHHMNTALRKSLFLVVMSASDYMECYERLMKLSLHPQQLRQVVKVLLECAQHEAKYNPYYSHVLLQLMRMDGGKEIRFTTQLALWDLIKGWGETEQRDAMRLAKAHRNDQTRAAFQLAQQRQVINVAKLTSLLLREPTTGGAASAPTGGAAHRTASTAGGDPSVGGGAGIGGGLGLQALKAFDFHALSPLQLLFLTATLKDFLLLADMRHINSCMLRLHAPLEDKKLAATNPQRLAELRLLRDGIEFFLRHHLLPTAASLTNQAQGALLKQRIQSARKALQGNVDEDWMFHK